MIDCNNYKRINKYIIEYLKANNLPNENEGNNSKIKKLGIKIDKILIYHFNMVSNGFAIVIAILICLWWFS